MLSREIAESVFALMESRGIVASDVVAISLYNSGPTLHVESGCLLEKFAADDLTYADYESDLHGQTFVNGINVVAMFRDQSDMARMRAIGKGRVHPVFPALSEVDAI